MACRCSESNFLHTGNYRSKQILQMSSANVLYTVLYNKAHYICKIRTSNVMICRACNYKIHNDILNTCEHSWNKLLERILYCIALHCQNVSRTNIMWKYPNSIVNINLLEVTKFLGTIYTYYRTSLVVCTTKHFLKLKYAFNIKNQMCISFVVSKIL